MHEMSIAMSIVDSVAERAEGARVVRVRVQIGKLAAVLPDALRFCFELACEGTVLAGAKLEIEEVLARARCRACGVELELERPFGHCACGSAALDWLSGEELLIREMEVV